MVLSHPKMGASWEGFAVEQAVPGKQPLCSLPSPNFL